MELTRDGFVEADAPVAPFAGTTSQLVFMLVSRGGTNAVVEIKDTYTTIAAGVAGVEPLTTVQDTEAPPRAFYWVELEQ
jgi:hypothetical protein